MDKQHPHQPVTVVQKNIRLTTSQRHATHNPKYGVLGIILLNDQATKWLSKKKKKKKKKNLASEDTQFSTSASFEEEIKFYWVRSLKFDYK